MRVVARKQVKITNREMRRLASQLRFLRPHRFRFRLTRAMRLRHQERRVFAPHVQRLRKKLRMRRVGVRKGRLIRTT